MGCGAASKTFGAVAVSAGAHPAAVSVGPGHRQSVQCHLCGPAGTHAGGPETVW